MHRRETMLQKFKDVCIEKQDQERLHGRCGTYTYTGSSGLGRGGCVNFSRGNF